ncbi:YfhO family protein [Mucilaginibacter daejeonensis]|uniref:YfhO family protein n=1 Tax=Mucilaginibacter daejeonensis TaxID=398049 RepID=UPI001D1784ED|nr:YfhO family protein [Mucilaginibacter daejeonensis]UEG52967.1 YfhO family protein [Mucilaginibacter daejeonensis]
MNNWFKRNGIHFAIFGLFLVICFLYFTPAFQGKALGQNDVTRARSTQKEIMDYRAKGETILWTNQILGGMPTFQIWAPYAKNITSHIVSGLKAVFPNPIDTVLILLLGAYFLFRVLRINPWLAAAGAAAFTFSSYNIILMVAGHANQIFAIAFFAPIIASILLTLRGKHLLGASLTALFLAMEIRANHIQMTYYLMMALLILVCIEFYHAFKTKQTAAFIKSVAYLAGALALAVAVNASILWSTYEYGKYTYRGKSNLTKNVSEPAEGLDKDYTFAWSQGIGECLTFLVPNAYGGASGMREVDPAKSGVTKAFVAKGLPQDQAEGYTQQLGGIGLSTYWGDKQFTEGPFYFGAIICFMFVLGVIIVKDRLKWWLLGTVVFTMLLSFGRHFPLLSDLFFSYFPLYNKFRAVESILAVAGLCFPLLAVLAVQEVIAAPDKKALTKKALLALYIVGGIALVLFAIPSVLLSFRSANQQDLITYLTQAFQGDSALANSVMNGLVEDRASLARMDAMRSLIFILIAFGLLWAYLNQKVNSTLLSLAFFLLILVDMCQVDKRYLNNDSFTEKQNAQDIQPREVDTFIMRDTDPNYRVFDATQSILQDAVSPYFHKSIGGYSAARLKRYDELIENQFSKSVNEDVLDMLNVKYIISADQKNNAATMRANTTACGNAWFVKSIKLAKNADEEMQAISSFDPKNEAIVDQQYSSVATIKNANVDPAATIKLTSYNPDHLVYQSGSTTDQIAVFSEVYYEKGWTMLIDGVEKPYFRADYLLRAAPIPVGNHKIEFIFHPASYYTGEGISLASSAVLVLLLLGTVVMETRKKNQLAPKA